MCMKECIFIEIFCESIFLLPSFYEPFEEIPLIFKSDPSENRLFFKNDLPEIICKSISIDFNVFNTFWFRKFLVDFSVFLFICMYSVFLSYDIILTSILDIEF